MKKSKWAGFGLISAIASTSCCITPLCAALAGTGGFTSSLSFLNQYKFILVAISVAALGLAWYQHLRAARQSDDCGCGTSKKKHFLETKTFLTGVTLFSMLMLGLPFFVQKIRPHRLAQVQNTSVTQAEAVTFRVEGMSCTMCEEKIYKALKSQTGIYYANASYDSSQVVVHFDPQLSNLEAIQKSISDLGYQVTMK